MKNRKLTVRWTRYDHPIQGKTQYYFPPPVPFLLLKGYWLEDAGFEIGQQVTVDVKHKKLTIALG